MPKRFNNEETIRIKLRMFDVVGTSFRMLVIGGIAGWLSRRNKLSACRFQRLMDSTASGRGADMLTSYCLLLLWRLGGCGLFPALLLSRLEGWVKNKFTNGFVQITIHKRV